MLWGVPVTIMRVSPIVLLLLILGRIVGDDWREPDTSYAGFLMVVLLVLSIARVFLGPRVVLAPSAAMAHVRAWRFIFSVPADLDLTAGHAIILFVFWTPVIVYGYFSFKFIPFVRNLQLAYGQSYDIVLDTISVSLFLLMAGTTAVYRARAYLAARTRP